MIMVRNNTKKAQNIFVCVSKNMLHLVKGRFVVLAVTILLSKKDYVFNCSGKLRPIYFFFICLIPSNMKFFFLFCVIVSITFHNDMFLFLKNSTQHLINGPLLNQKCWSPFVALKSSTFRYQKIKFLSFQQRHQ